MNILDEKFYFLCSTNFKLLVPVKLNSLNMIFFKYIMSVRGGVSD